MPIIGSGLSGILAGGQAPAPPDPVIVTSVDEVDVFTYRWSFSADATCTGNVAALQIMTDDGYAFSPTSTSQWGSASVVCSYESAVLVSWRVIEAPSNLTFADGATLSLPQSGELEM